MTRILGRWGAFGAAAAAASTLAVAIPAHAEFTCKGEDVLVPATSAELGLLADKNGNGFVCLALKKPAKDEQHAKFARAYDDR